MRALIQRVKRASVSIDGALYSSIGAGMLAGLLLGDPDGGGMIGVAVYWILLLMMLFGPANKYNANDNTSGVAVVLSLVEKNLNSNKVAYVLFDNEEKGLIGSTAFSKLHKDWKRNKLFVNLDCVGNGDQILILAKKEAKSHKNFENLTKNVQTNDKFSVHYFPMESSVANSDHKNFDCGVAIVACKKHKFLRFYASRIHTNLDVVASVENVSFLAEKLSNFSNSL